MIGSSSFAIATLHGELPRIKKIMSVKKSFLTVKTQNKNKI
jgi:hypothetical protein